MTGNLFRFVADAYTRCDKAVCAYFVAAICRANCNQFEFVRQIAATMIFTCHTRRFVAATCILSLRVSRPLPDSLQIYFLHTGAQIQKYPDSLPHLHLDKEAVSGKKMLRIQKNTDTCGGCLTYPLFHLIRSMLH